MLWTWLDKYSSELCLALLAVVLLLLISTIILNRRVHTLQRRYSTLTRGLDGADWQMLMLELNDNIAALRTLSQAHENKLAELDGRMLSKFTYRAMVHYDAFEHVYGSLSFSLALLDEEQNGFVFTNIHGREDARCYLKRLVHSESDQPLSDEEKEAIALALKGERA